MLLVKTVLNKSSIQGVGVFASEPIFIGTPVWEWNDCVDKKLQLAELLALPQAPREFIWSHAMLIDKVFHLPGDCAMFINHSAVPNTVWDEDRKQLIATKNITSGEEITESYAQYCPEDTLVEYKALGFETKINWA